MSLDLNELVRGVKLAAVEAVRAGGPMGLCFGRVSAVDPLEITVDQKEALTGAQLILTNNVRDYSVAMTVDHETEAVSHGHPVVDNTGGGSAGAVDHSHPYRGTKVFRVHLGLRLGEQVVLLRCDGGQQFIVLDRWEAP